MSLSLEPVTHDRKIVWILAILGAALLLAGSVYAADWMNFAFQKSALYPAIAKPFITLLAFVLVLMTGRNKLGAAGLDAAAAGLLLHAADRYPDEPGGGQPDASGSAAGSSWSAGCSRSSPTSSSSCASPGAGLPSRNSSSKISGCRLLIYGVAAVDRGDPVEGPGARRACRHWSDLHRLLLHHHVAFVGDGAPQALPPAQRLDGRHRRHLLVCHRDLRRNLQPGWGTVSDIVFRLVWVFYGTNVVLWALSGYRWTKAEVQRTHKPKR